MRLDPALTALVADAAPLHAAGARAAAAARGWAEAEGAALRAELARFGGGAPLAACPALGELFAGDGATADAAAAGLVGRAVAALRAAPLAGLPWRHFTNGVLHSLVLAASGRASLSLALLDGPAWRAARDPAGPGLVSFQPGELQVRVLAGSARARVLRNRSGDRARARIEAASLPLHAGVAYALDGAREALELDAVDDGLVMLRLHRAPAAPPPARQYDGDGALVHQAAGGSAESRAELMMALLRAMGRADAAPVLAARAQDGAPHARWQALRECLALDAATGFAALLRVASASGDTLAAPARALAATLAARHPQLEDQPCPA